MNLLLFRRAELGMGGALTVSGRRAEHLCSVIKVAPGDSLRVGEIEGRVGLARVSGICDTKEGKTVEIEVGDLDDNPPQPNVDLILALPRPQMLKRILENAPGFGVRRIYLARTARVEKSYFATPVLRAENLEHHLLVGAEQAAVTHLPHVSIVERFSRLMEDVLTSDYVSSISNRFIAHQGGVELSDVSVWSPAPETNYCQSASSEKQEQTPIAVVAIGPEGGWLAHEVDAFLAKGFRCIGLGPRILRVETAVYAALANVQSLYHSKVPIRL